jgi:hypothetical protein
MAALGSEADVKKRSLIVRLVPLADIGSPAGLKIYDFVLGFRIIFFAISSAAIRSERGMNGLLLQPGREEERLLCPGLHLVTGWAAISFSSRAASSSRVSPINTRLVGFRPRLNCVFLLKLIITLLQSSTTGAKPP